MYLPKHYREDRPEVLHALMRAHPLGMLVTHTAGGLDANHVPFELAAEDGEHGVLRAHVARSNPVWRDVQDGAAVMVVFRGPEAYVSPSWYPSKHETHKQVPTWNYEVVHAHGRLRVRDDERFVRGLVGRLTRTHEAHEPTPWKMGDAPREFIDQLLAAIVGIEVHIERLEGKRKLSQNREARDIRGAAQALHARGATDVATAMEEFLPHGPAPDH
jgi:transcriptional regulator